MRRLHDGLNAAVPALVDQPGMAPALVDQPGMAPALTA
jgi:hypothetical protein